jgi:hypothetical protein
MNILSRGGFQLSLVQCGRSISAQQQYNDTNYSTNYYDRFGQAQSVCATSCCSTDLALHKLNIDITDQIDKQK